MKLEDEIAHVKYSQDLEVLRPYLEPLIERRKELIVRNTDQLLKDGKLTPEQALAQWAAYLALDGLIRSFNSRAAVLRGRETGVIA